MKSAQDFLIIDENGIIQDGFISGITTSLSDSHLTDLITSNNTLHFPIKTDSLYLKSIQFKGLEHIGFEDAYFNRITLKNTPYFQIILVKHIETIEPIDTSQLEALLSTCQSDSSDQAKVLEQLINTYTALLHLVPYISQKQTLDKNIILKEKWNSFGQLAAGIAHEVNNPLGFIENNIFALKLYTDKFKSYFHVFDAACTTNDHNNFKEDLIKEKETLKIDIVLDDLNELFQQTHEGLKRIKSIIRSLVDFTKFNQTKSFDKYDLNEGINKTLLLTKKTMSTVTLNTQLESVSLIEADQSTIDQVLLNLILNAQQAIDKKIPGDITIKTFEKQNDIFFSITDNGPGIPEAIQKKVFDPFFTTKSPGKGLGLGLSICYDIIQKHQGHIEVNSVLHQGTTVTVKLPKTQS